MTLQELIDRRQAYLAAESAILQGQEYRIQDGGMSRALRRADLSEVRAAIAELNAEIDRAQAATQRRPRVMYLNLR